MSCTSCPIYYPTLEEFSNFFQYIQKIEKTLNLDDYGLIKVIPPDGWYHSFDNINEIEDMTVLKPVIQLISHVSTGIYTVNLLEKSNITVNKFYEYANKNSLNKENLSYEEIERKFWRSIGLNGGLDDPMYGADMVGTLFGNDHASSWNINNLQTPLKIIGKNLPGVSNAMLYFGCWRASFAFHTEDMELYSINYLHYGAPKSWYSIPPKYKKRFEVMAQSYYPEEYYQCSEFLRHKTSLISPSRLKDCAIPYHTAVQEKGEFMITFPGSYHQGFNHGFNIAEATNFATERWIEVARDARICHCQPDSVKIDMDIFETLYYRDKMKKKLMLQSHNQNNSIIDLTASNEEGSSAQSDNLLNTNNNEENQWLLRCKCGKRVWYPLIPVPEDSSGNVKDEIHNLNFAYLVVAEGDIFQCVDCGLWCHIECIFGENCTGDTLSDDARCHMCSNLDISSVSGEEDDHLQYQISVSSQRDTLTSCSQEDNNVETENSERITIPKVHKFRPKLRDNITASVYSTSLLKYVDVTGDIVAIDGTNIRIHVKGTKRVDDHWINISEYSFTDDIILNHRPPSKQSEKKLNKSTTSKKLKIEKFPELNDTVVGNMDDKNDYIHQKRKKTEQEESVDDNALPVTKKHFLLTAITQEDIDDGKFQEIPLSALNQEEEEVEEEEEVWERLPSEYDVIELSD